MFKKVLSRYYAVLEWWFTIAFARDPMEGLRVLTQEALHDSGNPERRIMIASVMHGLVLNGKLSMWQLGISRSTLNKGLVMVQEGIIRGIESWRLPEFIEEKLRAMLDDDAYRRDCLHLLHLDLEDIADDLRPLVDLNHGPAWQVNRFREIHFLITRFGIDVNEFGYQPWRLLQIFQQVEAGICNAYAMDRLTSADVGMFFETFRAYLEGRQRLAHDWRSPTYV